MNHLQVIERDNQRVMTTAVLAEEYGTTVKVISNNFNNNKERYTEGKHFYYLEGEELKDFLQSTNLGMQNSDKIRSLYLWTEKGALLHAKSLGTDRAWEVYEILVDTYFKVQKPMSSLELAELQLKISKELDQKIDTVNEDLQAFKLDLPLLGVECDKITTAVRTKGVHCLGGKESTAYQDKSLRQKLYSDIYREIKRQFGLSSYKAIKRNQCDIAVDIIGAYEPPFVLKQEISDCNAQECMV